MYILADIGGSKTRVAGSRDLQSFSEPVVVPTKSAYVEGIAEITNIAHGIAAGDRIDGMAIGITGVQTRDKRRLISNRHPDWANRELADDLEKALSTRVFIENDTALIGLGEAMDGAGVNAPILVYITVSTGVGGVRIVDSVIGPTAYGFEIGGQYLAVGEDAATIEEMISGRAIEKKYGKHPKELGKDSPVWEDLAVLFAYALHNTILHWSPDRVVLGGSMFNEIGIPVDRVAVHVKEIMKKFPEIPEIVHSKLGDFGGLHGGMARLKRFAA